MNYRASFCDPFQKDIIELGYISQNDIIDKFEKTPWADFLARMANVNENEIIILHHLKLKTQTQKTDLPFQRLEILSIMNLIFFINDLRK